MTYETPFGTTVDAESPFDGDRLCSCGAENTDGTDCDDCFEARWSFRRFDPMVELLDEIDALTPTTTLLAA